MKHLHKTLSVGLVLGAMLLAGCATESKAPDISTASEAEGIVFGAAFTSALGAVDFDSETPPDGVAISMSEDGSTISITFTNYDDGAGDILNGEMTISGSSNETKQVIHFNANLVISGATEGTVALSMTIVMTASSETVSGTVTIDGNKYSFSQDLGPPTASVAGTVGSFARKLHK